MSEKFCPLQSPYFFEEYSKSNPRHPI